MGFTPPSCRFRIAAITRLRQTILPLSLCLLAPALAAWGMSSAAGSAGISAADPTDPSNLPLGDGKFSTTGAQRGYIYRCNAGGGGGGAGVAGPWIRSDGTYDFTAKAIVDGSVDWPQATHKFKLRERKNRRVVSGNGLPTHTTGVYPIQPSDDAYQFDRNPNSISAQSVFQKLRARPSKGAPQCMGGEAGVAKNGVAIFNGFDAANRDAVAWEVQDHCGGHPQNTGIYHYHNIPACLYKGDSKREHSSRVGFAYDGFPIYGPRGSNGKLLTNAKLDVCHGHTHKVKLDGERVRSYHYHATLEFPYTVSCFRGAAVDTTPDGGPPPAPPGG